MQGYEVGADDYMTKPFEAEVLVARLRKLNEYRAERHELRDQYRLVQATAHTAITGSSELGVAMIYLEKSIGYTSVDDTMEGLLETTDRLNMDCAIRVETATGVQGYASEGTISPLEQELLDSTNRDQRFVDFGCRTLVHFSAITILIKNMPLEDMGRYGRIKDLIPLLLSAANTKLNALKTHHALIDQSDELKSAFTGIRKNLFYLAELIVNNRKRSRKMMSDSISDLSVDLMSMSLAEEQEDFLLGRIESSITNSLTQMDSGAQIRESLSFVLESLEETMNTHDKLLTAFIEGQAKVLDDIGDVDDGVDLF